VKEPIWIRDVEALAFHAQQIAIFGGSDGVRDRGMLESAFARPKNQFAYAETAPPIAQLAAAYAYGISSNHPFVDGNQRMAMQVSFVFLEFNGHTVTATQEDAYLTILALAAGDVSEKESRRVA
jgi:death-on-curing protein